MIAGRAPGDTVIVTELTLTIAVTKNHSHSHAGDDRLGHTRSTFLTNALPSSQEHPNCLLGWTNNSANIKLYFPNDHGRNKGEQFIGRFGGECCDELGDGV
jgi:hypothetical protein